MQLEVHFSWHTSTIINAHTYIVSPSGQWHKSWPVRFLGPCSTKLRAMTANFKKIKIVLPKHQHKPTKNIRSLAISSCYMSPGFILDDPVDIFLTFYPKSWDMPQWKCPISTPNKKGKLNFWRLRYSVAQWIQPSSRWRLLWSDDYDVINTDATWWSRFGEIMSSVYLVDNIKITADLLFKVHPLFEHLNDINNTILIAEHVAVDDWVDNDWVIWKAWVQAVY